MNQQKAFEIVRCRAAKGVSADELTAALPALGEFLLEQPGFIQREFGQLVGADGQPAAEWIDLVTWESFEAAEKAAQKAMESEKCAPIFALMDMESVRMEHAVALGQTLAGQEAARI